MDIRKTSMMGRHDIVTMQEVKYLNYVTGICCFQPSVSVNTDVAKGATSKRA